MILKRIDKSGKWLTYKGTFEVRLRPFKFSEFKYDEDSDLVLEQFMYGITSWKGLNEEDGKPCNCTDDNKLYIYSYDVEFRIWVMQELEKMNGVLDGEIKNSKPSQGGTSRKGN